VDTNHLEPEEIVEPRQEVLLHDQEHKYVGPRSVVILVGR
jgi:hypothetical protein